MNLWAEKFQKKLVEKEVKQNEALKKFETYRDEVLKLYRHIESKVKGVDAIQINYKVTAQTTQGFAGEHEMVKA